GLTGPVHFCAAFKTQRKAGSVVHFASAIYRQDRPAPMYDAPYYRGSGKLQDKVAIVTGGDSGIGLSVAGLFARERPPDIRAGQALRKEVSKGHSFSKGSRRRKPQGIKGVKLWSLLLFS